jgi:YD repeat-containing protein
LPKRKKKDGRFAGAEIGRTKNSGTGGTFPDFYKLGNKGTLNGHTNPKGNMTQNGSTTYTYDAENRLTSTSGCSFNYDGDGNRVQSRSQSNPQFNPMEGT